MKCKKCSLEIDPRDRLLGLDDWSNYEFIYKTGHCRNCLIDLGYCD